MNSIKTRELSTNVSFKEISPYIWSLILFGTLIKNLIYKKSHSRFSMEMTHLIQTSTNITCTDCSWSSFILVKNKARAHRSGDVLTRIQWIAIH